MVCTAGGHPTTRTFGGGGHNSFGFDHLEVEDFWDISYHYVYEPQDLFFLRTLEDGVK